MANVIILSDYDINCNLGKNLNPKELCSPINCDILLCLPKIKLKNLKITTKIAIVYGDVIFNHNRNIDASKFITYGMSAKNTFTISSVDDDSILIAIQREINNFSGEKLSISEFSVPKNHCSEMTLLGLNALKLIIE